MRCEHVENMLRDLRLNRLTDSDKNALKNHLTTCNQCRTETTELDSALRLLQESVKTNPIPIEVMKQRLEQTEPKKKSVLLPIGITGSVAAILIVVVVYLFQMNPNGIVHEYEVAIEGVLPHYIENNDTICDMLETNGLIEAGYDVKGCQQTCALVVYNLRTKQEAELVIELFNQLAPKDITSEIIPI